MPENDGLIQDITSRLARLEQKPDSKRFENLKECLLEFGVSGLEVEGFKFINPNVELANNSSGYPADTWSELNVRRYIPSSAKQIILSLDVNVYFEDGDFRVRRNAFFPEHKMHLSNRIARGGCSYEIIDFDYSKGTFDFRPDIGFTACEWYLYILGYYDPTIKLL